MDVISVILGILSILLAIWAVVTQLNTRYYLKTQSFKNYRIAGLLLRSSKDCVTEIEKNNNKKALKNASETVGYVENIFQESIANIKFTTKFKSQDLENWINSSKIDSHHANDFKKYL